MKVEAVCPETQAKLWRNASSCNAQESFKTFLHPQPDDFHNVIRSTDTHIAGQVLTKNQSVMAVLTGRQQNEREKIASLAEDIIMRV